CCGGALHRPVGRACRQAGGEAAARRVGEALERHLDAERSGAATPKTEGRYRTSPVERRLLDLSGRLGVPRSVLLGRESRSVTSYHYDDDGRLAWSETTYSPEWLDDDLDGALEWLEADDLACGGCGQPLDVATDEALGRAWYVEG